VRIRLITIAAAVLVLFMIVELVRRRKLKEEYSLLWVLTASVLVVLSIWYGLLEKVTHLIGGSVPSSTLFFFGLVFVVSLLLHFSIRISLLERRITALVQELGMMALENRRNRDEPAADPDQATEPRVDARSAPQR
jgi:hypothetical protein